MINDDEFLTYTNNKNEYVKAAAETKTNARFLVKPQRWVMPEKPVLQERLLRLEKTDTVLCLGSNTCFETMECISRPGVLQADISCLEKGWGQEGTVAVTQEISLRSFGPRYLYNTLKLSWQKSAHHFKMFTAIVLCTITHLTQRLLWYNIRPTWIKTWAFNWQISAHLPFGIHSQSQF